MTLQAMQYSGDSVPVRVWDFPLVAGWAPGVDMHALSREESARAGRFHFERDRSRFTIARACLRHVLGRLLQVAPEEVALVYGRHGKPALAPSHDSSLAFNLTHCDDRALIAVAEGDAVGVDLEAGRDMVDLEGVAGTVLSTREQQDFAATPVTLRRQAFLRYWTCKEAYMKALGLGVHLPPDSFTLSAFGHAPALEHPAAGDTGPCAFWYQALSGGWHAAVALRAPAPPRVQWCHLGQTQPGAFVDAPFHAFAA